MPIEPDKIYPDQLTGFPHPAEALALMGHEAAEQSFLEASSSGRLHHAWLLQGNEGIGKASLSYRLARYMLAPAARLSGEALDVDGSHRDAQLITARTHPNLLVLRRQWREKTKKFATEITVDNVRELHHFLGNTAGRGAWRVVIVDRADELNINAANALLKMLEEPPASCLFLLVSSEPGRLPATIRSRCRKLRLSPLRDDRLEQVLQRFAEQGLLELPAGEDKASLLHLAQGRVRRALELAAGHALEDIREIEHILDLLPRVDAKTSLTLSEKLGGRGREQDYNSFLDLLFMQFAARIKGGALKGGADKTALAQWAELWETVNLTRAEVERLNLDRSSFILDLFARIEKVAARAGGLSAL